MTQTTCQKNIEERHCKEVKRSTCHIMGTARYSRDPNREKPDPTNKEYVLLADFVVRSNNQKLRKLVIKIDARGSFTSIKNLIYGRQDVVLHTRYRNSS